MCNVMILSWLMSRPSISPSLSGAYQDRRSLLHIKLTPCRSMQSSLPCLRQAKIERAQIVLNRSQPGLPRSTGSASPVFSRTPNAGLTSSRMIMTGVGTTKMAKEKQAPSTDSMWQEWLTRTRPNHVIRDKIRPYT